MYKQIHVQLFLKFQFVFLCFQEDKKKSLANSTIFFPYLRIHNKENSITVFFSNLLSV